MGILAKLRAALTAAVLTLTLVQSATAAQCRTDGGSASFNWDYSNPEYVLVTTNNCPDHAFANTVGPNPNSAVTKSFSFKLPKKPIFRNNNQGYNTKIIQSTGPAGISLSGVVLFGPATGAQPAGQGTYAGQTLTLYGDAGCDPNQGGELDTFDYCGGHATPDGTYHYHVDPYCIRKSGPSPGQGHSALLGFMPDGIALYGMEGDNGNLPTDLDTCGGHDSDSGADGLYHYHLKSPEGPFPQQTGEKKYSDKYFPYTPVCLMGCVYDESTNANSIKKESFSQCKQTGTQASKGFLQTFKYEPISYDYSLNIPYDPVVESQSSSIFEQWIPAGSMIVVVAVAVGAVALIAGAAIFIRRRTPRPEALDYHQLPSFSIQNE